MAGSTEENKLKRCLEECINLVACTILRLRPEKESEHADSSNTPLVKNPLDTNIHAFSVDARDEPLLEQLKSDLENEINTSLPVLPRLCRKYLLDLLHEHNYDYDKREFTHPFNVGLLDSFARELKGVLASLRAFQAAWDGKKTEVQQYIAQYPSAKNKSGLWGTTLLYSAAHNGHLSLVRYLVRNASCSVNAQNQQHIMRALAAPIHHDDDFEANPTAGSTALHGACFYGHLEVVKFLINEGADYFLRNHAEETPIDNAAQQRDILQHFRDFLVLGYSVTAAEIPDKPILEGSDQRIVDCVWEYKPFANQTWYPFSVAESTELQGSLLVKPDQDFKREIHLRVRSGVYSVSLIQFLRSGKDHDLNQRLAWVRCRGSSLANFDCYGLWQIMLIKCPQVVAESSLAMLDIPSVYDCKFKIKLESWYYCDARTSDKLDRSMKSRRKYINLELPFIGDEALTFDLQSFSFKDGNGTVFGFIRWIPKMISSSSKAKHKIIGINEFQTLAAMDLIPLTTTQLKEISQTVDRTSMVDEEEFDKDLDKDDSFSVRSLADDAPDAIDLRNEVRYSIVGSLHKQSSRDY